MDETEQRIIDLIEEHRQEILDFARDIEGHPEPGFQEVRTAKKTAELLKKYGYEVQEGIALTGVRGGWNSQDGGLERISGAGKKRCRKKYGKVSEYFSDRGDGCHWMQSSPDGRCAERHSPRLRPPCSDGCAGRGGNGFCRS